MPVQQYGSTAGAGRPTSQQPSIGCGLPGLYGGSVYRKARQPISVYRRMSRLASNAFESNTTAFPLRADLFSHHACPSDNCFLAVAVDDKRKKRWCIARRNDNKEHSAAVIHVYNCTLPARRVGCWRQIFRRGHRRLMCRAGLARACARRGSGGAR